MKTVLRISFFYVLNLYLVAAFQNEAIFSDENINREAIPPQPYSSLIVPGTKWCGPGDTATDYDDLGIFQKTDKCCRSHDHCPDFIEPGGTLHSLMNPDIFPRLSCPCEQEFMSCLQDANTVTSKMVGTAYFGARGKCFQLAHPVVKCEEYQKSKIGKRCIKFTFDELQPMTWQFLHNPFYTVKK